MNGSEDESTSRRRGFDIAPQGILDLSRRPEVENRSRIRTTTPNVNPVLNGGMAAAGPVRLFPDIAPLLANRDGFRATESLSTSDHKQICQFKIDSSCKTMPLCIAILYINLPFEG